MSLNMPEIEAIYTEEEKAKMIKSEVSRLKKLFKEMPKSYIQTVKALIENAAFMSVILCELQEYIKTHGVTDTYQNGENQWGTKKSPQVEVHIAMTKNFNATMKQLTDLIPKQNPKTKDDGFDTFVSDR